MFSGASSALANLAPIPIINPVAGAGELNFRALTPVQSISSQPEAIAAGFAQGAVGLSKGYAAAVQQKRQDEKDEKAEKKLLDQAAERKAKEDREFALRARHEMLLEKQWEDRLSGAVPSGKKQQSVISLGSLTSEKEEDTDTQQEMGPLEQSLRAEPDQRFHRDFSTPLNDVREAEQQLVEPGPSVEVGPGPLSDLRSVVPTPSSTGFGSEMPAISSVPPEVLNRGAGPSMVSPLAAVPPLASVPRNFGAASLPKQLALEKELYAIEKQQQAPKAPSKDKRLEEFMGVEGPYDLPTAKAIQNYAEATGRGKPTIKKDGTLDWKDAQAELDRRERIDNAKKFQEERLTEAALQGLGSMNLQFNSTHNQPMNDLNKSIGALPQFLEEYENLTTHPTAQGINDLGLIDAYVRFAKGAAPNQMQIEEVKKELSVPDKLWLMYKNKQSGAFLPPDVRQNMLDVVTGTYNLRANMLNPKLRDQRKIIDSSFPNAHLIEEQKPHEYPVLRTKPFVTKEIETLGEQASRVADEHNAAAKAGNKEKAAQLKAKYDELEAMANKARKELGKLEKRNGVPEYDVLYGNFGWTPGSVGKNQPFLTQPVSQ